MPRGQFASFSPSVGRKRVTYSYVYVMHFCWDLIGAISGEGVRGGMGGGWLGLSTVMYAYGLGVTAHTVNIVAWNFRGLGDASK